MTLIMPKCIFCKHCFDDNYNEEEFCCDAFPDGIPDEKLFSGEEEECANGIKYEEE